jgi:hypothetical protein
MTPKTAVMPPGSSTFPVARATRAPTTATAVYRADDTRPNATNPATHTAQPPPATSAPAGGDSSPRGGDLADCLDDSEIDAILAPVIGPPYLAARLFYDARVGTDGSTFVDAVDRTVATHGYAIGAVHTRHHWAMALYTASRSPVVADSAPSPATARDFHRAFSRFGLGSPTLICPARQVSGSNECGIHAVLNALAFSSKLTQGPSLRGAVDHILSTHNSDRMLSLDSWRAPLARVVARVTHGLTPPEAHQLLQLAGIAPATPPWSTASSRHALSQTSTPAPRPPASPSSTPPTSPRCNRAL